jgi:hypothetical protein
MKFCNTENFYDLFAMPNAQTQIIKHLMSLREKGLSSNSISTRLNTIYHFYDMNDVALNKKKINNWMNMFQKFLMGHQKFNNRITEII